MLWIILIVIIIIAAFAVPRFGKALLIAVGIALLAVAALYIRNNQEEEAAKKRITASEIDLIDLHLLPHSYSNESFEISCRIRNKSSRYTLTDMRLRVTLKDCIDAKKCETVGDSTAWVFATVPPGQSRELRDSMYFSNLGRPSGKFEWDYSIEQISGK